MNEDIEMKDSSKTNEKDEKKEQVSKEEQEKLILEGTEKKYNFFIRKGVFLSSGNFFFIFPLKVEALQVYSFHLCIIQNVKN